MPKICYTPKKFDPVSEDIIKKVNLLVEEYAKQGITSMTVRQVYYRFVARDWFPKSWNMSYDSAKKKWVQDENGTNNNGPNYTRIQGLISAGRLAGLIDWHAIIDRTRGMIKNKHYTKPKDAIKEVYNQYKIDKWFDQPWYLEVWVEKDALASVLIDVCSELDVPFFACRGYTSSTASWDAGQRLLQKIGEGKQVRIIHLGDHDPSGVDMSRDVQERLSLFVGQKVPVRRVALNMPQIEQYNPPPNPAKTTDARFRAYQEKYGDLSWELDALAPEVLIDIVRRAVLAHRDEELWKKAVELEQKGKKTLRWVVNEFGSVCSFLKEKIEEDKEAKLDSADPD